MAADTRTNAGVDNVATFRKLHTWSVDNDRVFILLSAGNLAITQAVIALMDEGFNTDSADQAAPSLKTADSIFEAAQIVGDALKSVRKTHADEGYNGDAFSASFLLGGQIGSGPVRLFQIYAEGNFIESTEDTPFFQIGEHKYGKPILDRVANLDMRLGEAAKVVLLSFDSTLRSNLSVGMPIDLVVYNAGTLSIDRVRRIEQDDPYFRSLSTQWSNALRAAVEKIEEFDI
jgi:putative proteasome-type protease